MDNLFPDFHICLNNNALVILIKRHWGQYMNFEMSLSQHLGSINNTDKDQHDGYLKRKEDYCGIF